MNASCRGKATRLLACAGLSALLAGCVGGNPFEEAVVDPRSPVAEEVQKKARANRDYPSFAEIPAMPNDVRPPRAFGDAAAAVESERAQLERETAPETWVLGDSEAFAARARSEAGPELTPSERNAADTERYARELRERATPPPPPR